MLVARNEMLSTLKAALAESALKAGDHAGASELFMWVMLHRLISWPEIEKAIATASQITAKLRYPVRELDERFTLNVDFDGSCMAAHANAIGDFAIAQALINNLSAVRIENACFPKILVPKLVHAAQRGLQATCFWVSEKDGTPLTRSYDIESESAYPSQTTSSLVQNLNDADAVLVIARNEAELSQYFDRHWTGFSAAKVIESEPQTYAVAYAESIESGIDVPDDVWNTLIKMSKQILVPSSAQSRQGAGG